MDGLMNDILVGVRRSIQRRAETVSGFPEIPALLDFDGTLLA